MNEENNPFTVRLVKKIIQKQLCIEEPTDNTVLRDCDDVTDKDIRHCLAVISCYLKTKLDINPLNYKTVGDIIKSVKESV